MQGPDPVFLEFTPPDVYQQVHPIERPDLIKAKLNELKQEINNIPEARRKEYNEAQVLCPDLVDSNEFLLQFLRCEQFRAKDAATRLIKYWKKRAELFGDKAYLPLTQEHALKGDEAALKAGFFRLLDNAKDPIGRSLIAVKIAHHDPSSNDPLSAARACWYIVHAALEDEETQKKGIIILSDGRDSKLSNVDFKLYKSVADGLRGCLPVRLSAIHLLHNPSFANIVLPIIKVFLGERLRRRIKIHNKGRSLVDYPTLALGKKYGLSKAALPHDLGGSVVLDHSGWLQERMAAGL